MAENSLVVDAQARVSLGERMKGHEAPTRLVLPRKTLTAVRVDGRAFHTWTRGLERPYSAALMSAMAEATQTLCEEVAGSVIGYTQSDEISVVFQDFASKHSEPWFGGVVQKVCSIAASCVTAVFARQFPDRPPALFDARAFTLPDQTEAANYLVWRQRDAQKNAVSMLAEHYFSSKSLRGMSTPERRARLIEEAGVNPDDEDPRFLHGQVLHRVTVTEKVSYRDKRTGETRETPEPVERRRWVAEAAPHFEATPDSWLLARIPQPPDRSKLSQTDHAAGEG